VLAVLERSGQRRWYPIDGGYLAKIPWHFAEGHETLFEREQWGWDHEHCDFCDEHVNIGEDCWTAENEAGSGFYIFCNRCAEKVTDDSSVFQRLTKRFRKAR
jgi:hypothetical protein